MLSESGIENNYRSSALVKRINANYKDKGVKKIIIVQQENRSIVCSSDLQFGTLLENIEALKEEGISEESMESDSEEEQDGTKVESRRVTLQSMKQQGDLKVYGQTWHLSKHIISRQRLLYSKA